MWVEADFQFILIRKHCTVSRIGLASESNTELADGDRQKDTIFCPKKVANTDRSITIMY